MKKSFVRKTVMLLTVHISILLFVLIAYILNSYQNAVDGVEQSAGNFIGLYGNEFNAISWMVSSTTVPYTAQLSCGSLDPDTEIDNFIKALNDAGYQDILEAKQEQLDAWLAE